MLVTKRTAKGLDGVNKARLGPQSTGTARTRRLCDRCKSEYEGRTSSKYCLDCRVVVYYENKRKHDHRRSHNKIRRD